MTEAPITVRATFSTVGSSAANERIDVHFNPESLQYTITNNLKDQGSGNATKQFVDKSTGELSMELVFDTTDTGEDVRLHTVRVAKLMEPGESNKTPPIVKFEWGLYTFSGMMKSYQETIDYFSADGVPLRAAVNLGLSSQDQVFEGGSDQRTADTGSSGGLANGGADGVQAASPPGSDGQGVTRTATQAGNPQAARNIADSNRLENMRFPTQDRLRLTAQGNPLPATRIVASGRPANSSPGNAFGGLHVQSTGANPGRLDLRSFLRPVGTETLGTEGGADFALGGQSRLRGSASFKSDVGSAGALKARIEFDGGD